MSVNPEPGEEPISLKDVGLDDPQVRHRRGRVVKTFSQWIQNEPKEKWCLMFDEGGARHGIKPLILLSLTTVCSAVQDLFL
jgi:hypothetical protein